MRYVDGFVVPVPKKNLQAYRRMAKTVGKVFRSHGALEFREYVADDVKVGKWTSFPRSRQAQVRRDRGVLLERVQVARAPRSGQCEGDEGPAGCEDDESGRDGPLQQAGDLRRFPASARHVATGRTGRVEGSGGSRRAGAWVAGSHANESGDVDHVSRALFP